MLWLTKKEIGDLQEVNGPLFRLLDNEYSELYDLPKDKKSGY